MKNLKSKWNKFIVTVLILTTIVTSNAICGMFGKPILANASTARQVEGLDRGLVAIKTSTGVFLSWRYLGTDSSSIGFNVYRNGTKINSSLITNSTNYLDASGSTSSTYYITAVVNNVVTETSKTVSTYGQNYFDIPLNVPSGGTTPAGEAYTYTPNDASVGDLDGDGEYEIILKWDPSNSKDNSQSGYTGNVIIDAYKLNGTRLWRIDLGKNIRAGAHYTQFMVYDFDGDGYSEMVCKTADGTKDGKGTIIGNSSADYRNSSGYILSGPEYLTLFDGKTGAALDTINYEPGRGTVSSWGDSYGNRVDRFLGAVAYLNGQTPSVVMCRGYYTRAVLVAYNVVSKKLVKQWKFDSNDSGNSSYKGQGNHNLAVADVDSDGYDEIVYGACTIDHNGSGLYSTGLGHGDAMHVGDFLPNRAGLEVWQCHESSYGASLRDAKTGQVLVRVNASSDTGRAVAGNFIPGNSSAEFTSYADSKLYDGTGAVVGAWSDITKWGQNFVLHWDADLEDEALDRTMVDKYKVGRLLTGTDVTSNNTTKANPSLCADILGDWRDEIVWPTTDGKNLRVYMTTDVTTNKIFTLMHDTQYRCQIASQNVAYNQPAHTSFFLGTGFPLPSQPNVYAKGFVPTKPTATPTPVVTTTPNPTGQYINSFVVKDVENASDWSIQSNLQVGDTVYGDRTTKFAGIPTSLLGAEWIRTACDSKASTSDLASFTAKSNVSIFVGLDSRVTTLPTWLSSWTKTSDSIVGDNEVIFNLYKKDFSSGSTVALGENGQSSGAVNYTVIIKPNIVVTPTVAPTVTPTVVPTVAPTVAPTVVPTVAPTVTPTSVPTTSPSIGAKPVVTVSTTNNGNSISQTYNIIAQGGTIDLSKVSIVYTATGMSTAEQNVFIDNAALQLNVAPFYSSINSAVTGLISNGKLTISTNSSTQLAEGTGKLVIDLRFAKTDWSTYGTLSNEVVKVYYNGVLVQ